MALLSMLVVSPLPLSARRCCASFALGMYGCSVYFHGWLNLKDRVADGGSPLLELGEAMLLAVLLLRSVVPVRSSEKDRLPTIER
jgi:hypothetical protein